MNSEENKKIANDLWLEYGPYIRDLCKHLLKGSPDCADDCVQEVFLALTEALGQGKAIVYPKTWLNKVAHNIVKDVYRKAKKDAERLEAVRRDLRLVPVKRGRVIVEVPGIGCGWQATRNNAGRQRAVRHGTSRSSPVLVS